MKTYEMFGWHQKKNPITQQTEDKICFIYPNPLSVMMCFPDFAKGSIARGEGEIVELEVKIKKIIS